MVCDNKRLVFHTAHGHAEIFLGAKTIHVPAIIADVVLVSIGAVVAA